MEPCPVRLRSTVNNLLRTPYIPSNCRPNEVALRAGHCMPSISPRALSSWSRTAVLTSLPLFGIASVSCQPALTGFDPLTQISKRVSRALSSTTKLCCLLEMPLITSSMSRRGLGPSPMAIRVATLKKSLIRTDGSATTTSFSGTLRARCIIRA